MLTILSRRQHIPVIYLPATGKLYSSLDTNPHPAPQLRSQTFLTLFYILPLPVVPVVFPLNAPTPLPPTCPTHTYLCSVLKHPGRHCCSYHLNSTESRQDKTRQEQDDRISGVRVGSRCPQRRRWVGYKILFLLLHQACAPNQPLGVLVSPNRYT